MKLSNNHIPSRPLPLHPSQLALLPTTFSQRKLKKWSLIAAALCVIMIAYIRCEPVNKDLSSSSSNPMEV